MDQGIAFKVEKFGEVYKVTNNTHLTLVIYFIPNHPNRELTKFHVINKGCFILFDIEYAKLQDLAFILEET